MLTGTVHTVEGLLVQEHYETVLAGDAVHQVHDNLVLVVGQVGLAIDGRQFKLVGRHLVVAGLERNAQTVAGNLQITHESGHARRDGGEVVVVQLLVLGRTVAEEGAAGNHQVCAGGIETLIHEEVLLLPAQVGVDLGHSGVEIFADGHGGVTHGLQGLLERGLVVQGFACVGNKDSRDAEGVVQDENRRGGIPGRISAGFERGTDAAAGERRGVRFLLGQHFPVEGFNDTAFSVVIDQGVVLLGRSFRQGLEPVGNMGYTVLDGPLLHAAGHAVRGFAVQGFAAFDAGEKGLEAICIKIFAHLFAVEDQLSIVIGGFTCRCAGGDFLLHEGFLDEIKSVHKYTY